MHDRFELWILSSCVGNISYMTKGTSRGIAQYHWSRMVS